jgi:hypothetical protein
VKAVKHTLMLMAMTMAAGAPTAGFACGACVEDKVAATYDHTVIKTAIAKHQQVVFVSIDGPVPPAEMGKRITAAASKVRGVQAGTLRTSIAPLAFSFALDAAQRPEVALDGFREAVGDKSARLTVVRVMLNGELIEPK